VQLVQSIFNHGDFEAETFNEGSLVKALEIAGYPVDYKSNRDCDQDYDNFLKEKFKKIQEETEVVIKEVVKCTKEVKDEDEV